MLEAVRAGAPLREVARAAECSHESVRRLVAADGAVSIELGADSYVLTGQQVEMLIYKLEGSARGAFPKDIELLGAGTAWLSTAAELAKALQTARVDEEGRPIVLNQEGSFALYQILRLTNTGRPTTLSQLYDTLFETYGRGEPHVIAALSRGKPRPKP